MAIRRKHRLVRFCSLLALTGSLVYLADQSGARVDVTAEGLSEVTDRTRELAASIDAQRPVVIDAYVSPDVPRAYVASRSRLLNVLRELKAHAGPGLRVNIHEPELFSEVAQQAEEAHGITPRPVFSSRQGRVEHVPVFLGVALSSGPREEVIPFFERGLAVEHELARAIEAVASEKKPVVGIVETGARLMGDFDMATRRQFPAWRIVDELEKQYEVRGVRIDADVAEDVDTLIVPQLSSLTQPQLDKLQAYLDAGRPALLVADPLPAIDPRLSPSEPLPPASPGSGFDPGGGQMPQVKGNYASLLEGLGVKWNDRRVVYDLENRNPQYEGVPPYVIFAPGVDGDSTGVSDGLAQIVTLFPGQLQAAPDASTTFTPLLATSARSGGDDVSALLDRSNPFMGVRGPILPERLGPLGGDAQTLAARVRGGEKDYNAIVLADLDMFADDFFAMHERGGDRDGDGLIDERFDNVTFLLNCLDALRGDDALIELRKRQPAFRRLERVEAYTKSASEERERQIDAAHAEAEKRLAAAQKALDEKVAAIDAREGVDETTKSILKRSAREAEQRRLDLEEQRIERDKARELDRIEAEHMRAVDQVRDRIRLASLVLPPIPALLLGFWIFLRKRRRERAIIPANRKRGAK